MAQDWASDVKKFVSNADDEVISAIVKYCGIALQNKDSSLVSFSDPVETGRVRENFLKKKLGLTHSDADLDAGIAAVGERMKGTSFKNRVTVYYLLLEQFGMLDFFRKGGAAIAGAAAAVGAGAAAVGLTGNDDNTIEPVKTEPVKTETTTSYAAPAAAAAATTAAAATAAPVHAATTTTTTDRYAATSNYDTDAYVEEEKSGMGWLWWLLGALALLGLLWWFFFRQPAAEVKQDTAAVATETTKTDAAATPATPAEDLTKAPAEGTVTIPTGAGVTSELRDSKPVVKVYFDTAKTEVAPAFAPAAAGLKAYLDSHAGSTLAVSGFNDPRGNAEANAKLSKGRAEAVKAELVKAGIADTAIELVKPEAATDKTVDNAGARRVEVVVR